MCHLVPDGCSSLRRYLHVISDYGIDCSLKIDIDDQQEGTSLYDIHCGQRVKSGTYARVGDRT